MTVTNTIKPIPTSKLSNWNSIRDTFTKTDPRMEARAQISGQIWADAGQSSLWMVPTVYNFDSIGYRPDLVDAEEANTWTSLFDKKFKGKTGLNVDPLIAFGQAILAMNSLGMLDVPNPGNPNKSEIDEASKFLISKKRKASSVPFGVISVNWLTLWLLVKWCLQMRGSQRLWLLRLKVFHVHMRNRKKAIAAGQLVFP